MPAGAHSAKKPSQHSLIIITTFAYIFSVSGGSAAALKTINNMTIRIPDGNAFRIRLTARNLISGEYTEAADLYNIDNLVINYVRRGIRFPHAYTIDEEGRATVADAGTLDCGFYGIELTGYYGGEKFRFYGKDLFEITDTTDVIDPSNLIDIEITVKLNASGVSKDYVDHAVNGMEASMETMQADLRDEIAEAGKVDDVKVNGVSVVSGKKANITVPTKVSDLDNDSGYQNEQQVQQKVDAAKITSADISVDGGTGTPSGSAGVSGNQLVIALHNIKGDKGDPGDTGATGPQGPQGESFQPIEDVSGLVLAHTTGQDNTKAISQKGVTDELEKRANEIEDELKVGYLKNYDLSIINRIQLYPRPDTNTWVNKIGSDNPYGIMVEVVPGDSLRISVPNSNRGVYCFLKDYYATKGDSVDYATGSSYESLEKGQTVNVVVPSDAHRLYLLVGKGDTSYQYTVSAIAKNSAKEFIGEEIDFGSYARHDKYISSSNVWTAGYSEYNRCVLIPISKGDVYYIKPTNVGCIIAFLSENTNVGSPIKFANGLASRIQLYSPALLTVPDNATLLYVFDNTKGIPMLPLCVNISKSPFGQAVKAGHGMYGTPIYHIVTQGYYSRTGDDMHININSDLVTRVKIGTSAITGAFRIVLNEGYHLRAVYSFDAFKLNGEQIVYDSEGLTDYTFKPSVSKPIAAVTICKDDATQSISPSENIVKFFGAPVPGLLEQVTDSHIVKKAVFLGDSITHGVYSYYDQDIHDDNHRYNGFDITDLSDIAMATRYHGIPYYFGLFADCECINIAKRGSGWVQDGRNIGNAYEVASAYDFSDVNFCALCFGINDYINGIAIGDIETMAADTLIGNMSLVLSKIFSDNPLCKVVVYSPYNCWGQVSHGGDYVSDVLYGDESTDYALGFDKGGGTLQEYIDAIDSVCQYYGVQHVPLSKNNIVNRLTLKNIMIDGLHPSKDSFRALAAEIYGKGNFGN